MNDWFNKQEAQHYFSKCHDLFSDSKDIGFGAHYSFVSERHSYTYTACSPPVINYESLTYDDIKALLETGFEHDCLIPDQHTYLVLDISPYKETPYNSLLMQLNEPPRKSYETTKTIMKRYFRHMKSPYSHMRKFGEALGYSSNTPYVMGETFFIPDGGASKYATSWLALHHITRYDYNDKKELNLYSNQHLLVTLNKKQKSFENQLNKVAHMYYIQTRMAVEFMAVMNFVRVSSLAQNIVHKHINEHSYTLPKFTIFEYFHYQSYFEVQSILSKLFGRENPYLDDARKFFKLPPFKLK